MLILIAAFAVGFLVVFALQNNISNDQCYLTYFGKCYGPQTANSNASPNLKPTVDSTYLNHTLSSWVIAWYNWIFPQNPTATYDQTGALNMKYQPKNSSIYYLAEEHDHVAMNRHIIMTPSKPLMFPVLNTLVVTYKPVDESKFLSSVNSIFANEGKHTAILRLDGKPINTTFIRTPVFHVQTYDHNKNFGDFQQGMATAASIGWWGFVNPPSPGYHKLEFFGGSPNYVTGAVYYINVTK